MSYFDRRLGGNYVFSDYILPDWRIYTESVVLSFTKKRVTVCPFMGII